MIVVSKKNTILLVFFGLVVSDAIKHKHVVIALTLPTFLPSKIHQTVLSTNKESTSSPSISSSLTSSSSSLSRRGAIGATLQKIFISGTLITTLTTSSCAPSNAFENHIDDYAKYTEKNKRRGTPPKDLGVQMRTTEGKDDTIKKFELRSCDGNPNCFSTTGDYYLEDRQQYGTDYLIQPWMPPPDDPKPFQTLIEVVKEYQPGQGGIDGGGFGIIEETDSYLYVQFESLKKGFIDDVEFAITVPPGKKKDDNSPIKILVRSGSRVGFTDFGVNAIRLNYIASKLRAKGWSIADITHETHRDYWDVADEARQETFDPDRRQMSGGV